MNDTIVVRGAREHNLRNVDLVLPRDQLIVFTGLSGSGKSSLAFDTIYAEGQRRYVESLSAYARQFLGQMDKPDVDFIEGLSPAISIDQKSASRNPRSTVGTITEIYDYLRLLYARIGIPHCPNCGRVITRQTPQQIVDRVLQLAGGHALPGARAGRARPQGRVPRAARRARRAGLHAGARRRRARRPPGEAERSNATSSTRSRSSSTGSCAARGSNAGSPTRSRPRCKLAEGVAEVEIVHKDETRRARDPHVLRAPRVHALRALVRGARAPQLLVQLAVRRVRGVRRARHAVPGRPRAGRSPTTTSRSTRARSRRGRDSGASTSSGCSSRWATSTASRPPRRGRSSRPRRRRSSSTAPAASRSRSGTRTVTGGSARTRPSTKA